MKKQNILKMTFCLLLSSYILWIKCCTFLGYGVGGSIGSKKMVPSTYDDIELGTIIKIQLLNDDIVIGEYRGFTAMQQDAYKRKYAEYTKQRLENQILPELGDSITIHLKSGEEISCELNGFDLIGIEEEPRYAIIAKKTNEMRTKNYRIKDISGISTEQGELFNEGQLTEFIDCCIIPVKHCIIIKNVDGVQAIAFNEVLQIQKTIKKRNTGGAFLGIVAGVILDYLIMESLLSSWFSCDCGDVHVY